MSHADTKTATMYHSNNCQKQATLQIKKQKHATLFIATIRNIPLLPVSSPLPPSSALASSSAIASTAARRISADSTLSKRPSVASRTRSPGSSGTRRRAASAGVWKSDEEEEVDEDEAEDASAAGSVGTRPGFDTHARVEEIKNNGSDPMSGTQTITETNYMEGVEMAGVCLFEGCLFVPSWYGQLK